MDLNAVWGVVLPTWVIGTLLLGLLAELLWLYVVVLRAYDVGYDKDRAQQKRINLNKAWKRRRSIPRLGFPLWLAYAASIIALFASPSWATYGMIAFAWFLTVPLRTIGSIAIARRVLAERNGRKPEISLWQDVVHYYHWGFALPMRPESGQWFEDRLAWLNKFQTLIRMIWTVLQLWRLWGLAGQLAISMLWPLTGMGAMFYYVEVVEDYDAPWWRINRRAADPRKKRVITGEVVK